MINYLLSIFQVYPLISIKAIQKEFTILKGIYCFVCANRRAKYKEISCTEIFSMGFLKIKQNFMCGHFR